MFSSYTVPSPEPGEYVGPTSLFPNLKIRVSHVLGGFLAIAFVQHFQITSFGVKP